MGFKHFLVYLLIVNSIAAHAQKAHLRFQNGDFKIVQITDVHLKARNKSSHISIETIEKVLDIENPDLVVFTGDIVVARPVFNGWQMVLKPCIERKIPYAVVFGNHDDECGVSRKDLAEYVAAMPYSLLIPQTKGVYGFGNYVVNIHASVGEEIAAHLFCMDSNSYSTNRAYKGYGWFMESQIEWFKEQNNNEGVPSLAFFHIPLPEYTEAFMNPESINKGYRNENECSPQYNSGMFAAMAESGNMMATFVGHDHDNDYMAYKQGIALSYGRFTGSSNTYGKLDCGARVIVLNEGEKTFTTWIRTGDGRKQTVVHYPFDLLPSSKEILTFE